MTGLLQTFKPILLFLLMTSWAFHSVALAETPVRMGGRLPAITLPVPNNGGEKVYLGISGEGSFKLSQINATVLIIEIFSLYCPQCQAAAPEVNALYQMIEEVPAIKTKIKMIGIGAGNTLLEVNTFKEKYQVPFPLFPDEDFTIHKNLGEVRTPYFIVAKFKKDRSSEVIYLKEGAFGQAEAFLQWILKASGLK